jgi:sodium-dependent dicarboxylate transporter 2/3/5
MSDQRAARTPDLAEAVGIRPRRFPLVVAVVLAAAAYAFPLPGISEEGRRLTAVLMIVGTLWIGEVIPLAVTALLGPALAVVTGVAPVERAFAAFGNPIIMLFVGSFLLARATFKHRLNERIAYRLLSLAVLRNDPARAFIFLGLTTAVLSAWMSNTATCAMMLPIAQSVLGAMIAGGGRTAPPAYAAALMLIVAYSASIGGLFTPIGTPPNLIGLGLIEQATGTRVSFPTWLAQVFPITAATLALMMAYFTHVFRTDRRALVYDRTQMAARYAQLGRWRPVEKRVIVALLVTVSLWLFPPLIALVSAPVGRLLNTHLPESVVPLLVAGVLFWTRAEPEESSPPVLSLGDLGRIDWPVIVLFGGGMCLGDLMIQSGFAAALGDALAAYVPAGDSPFLVLIFCLLAIGVSETTSNTASANMVIPVVTAVAARVGGDSVSLGLAATVACTFGFMLPVSTPTNAMAYATGHVTQRQMIRYGVTLDVIGAVMLTAWFGLVL